MRAYKPVVNKTHWPGGELCTVTLLPCCVLHARSEYMATLYVLAPDGTTMAPEKLCPVTNVQDPSTTKTVERDR